MPPPPHAIPAKIRHVEIERQPTPVPRAFCAARSLKEHGRMSNSNSNQPDQPDDQDPVDKFFGKVSDMFGKVSQIDPTRKPDDIDKFFRAVKTGKMEAVKAALESGLNPNVHDKSGDTPLHLCARGNLTAMAELLMAHKADPRIGKKDDPKHLPLDDAVNFGKPEITELLARHGGYLPGNTIDGWSLLHRACEKGKPRLVEALLKAGANGNEPTANGATPLLISVMRSQSDVANMLLDYPGVAEQMNTLFVRTDEKKRTAFQLAVERGQDAIARKMIAKGTKLNTQDADGMTPLQHAIRRGDSSLVTSLVAGGADINRANDHGTPLHYAAAAPELRDEAARAKMIDTLVRLGADPDTQDAKTGQTPLMILAASADKLPSLQKLLAHPVAQDHFDHSGMNAVFHALKNPKGLEMLLAAGAPPDARHMKDASTPLIAAAKNDDAHTVRRLLDAGANPRLFDARGKSALSYARDNIVNEYAGAANAPAIAAMIEEKFAPEMPARRKQKPRSGEWEL